MIRIFSFFFALVIVALTSCAEDEPFSENQYSIYENSINSCVIKSVVWEKGDKNPLNTCQVCNPADSMTDWTSLEDYSFCDEYQGLCLNNSCRFDICYIDSDTDCSPCEHGTRVSCKICDTTNGLRQWTFLPDGSACNGNGSCQQNECIEP